MEDDGQSEAGGKVGAHMTNLFFKVTHIGSRDSQGKSYPPITEEECMGQTAVTDFDLGALSVKAYAHACKSSHDFVDLAKVVVEIESNLDVTFNRYGLGQEEIREAQLGKERDPSPSHVQVDAGGCGSGPLTEPTLCAKGSTHSTSGLQGARLEESEQKEECNASPEDDHSLTMIYGVL